MQYRELQAVAVLAAMSLLLIVGAACNNSISATPQIQVNCAGADECFKIGAKAESEPSNPDPSKDDQYARAVAYYDEACLFDHAKACMSGSMIYWLGPSPVAQDLAKSLAMMERSCELEFSEGCGRLGDMYDNGWGVQPDRARALELYQQACAGGYQMACMDANRLSG